MLEVKKKRSPKFAIFENQETISALSPDMNVLCRVRARGVIASGPGRDVDFVSRFFAPRSGIPEDPVTGSAHTTLIPYGSQRLGKKTLTARQISRRGGELACKDLGPRVEIGGRAVTCLEGVVSL